MSVSNINPCCSWLFQIHFTDVTSGTGASYAVNVNHTESKPAEKPKQIAKCVADNPDNGDTDGIIFPCPIWQVRTVIQCKSDKNLDIRVGLGLGDEEEM